MTSRPVKVTIAYCAECGYEPQTLALAGALMTEFGHHLSSVEIIPWFDGSFDVSVGGQLVHSMMREGGFPAHETVARAVRHRLSGGAEATAENSSTDGTTSSSPVRAETDGAPGDDGEGTIGSASDAGPPGFDGAAVRALAADDTDSDG